MSQLASLFLLTCDKLGYIYNTCTAWRLQYIKYSVFVVEVSLCDSLGPLLKLLSNPWFSQEPSIHILSSNCPLFAPLTLSSLPHLSTQPPGNLRMDLSSTLILQNLVVRCFLVPKRLSVSLVKGVIRGKVNANHRDGLIKSCSFYR